MQKNNQAKFASLYSCYKSELHHFMISKLHINIICFFIFYLHILHINILQLYQQDSVSHYLLASQKLAYSVHSNTLLACVHIQYRFHQQVFIYFLYRKINQRMIEYKMTFQRYLNFSLNELHKGQQVLYLFKRRVHLRKKHLP